MRRKGKTVNPCNGYHGGTSGNDWQNTKTWYDTAGRKWQDRECKVCHLIDRRIV